MLYHNKIQYCENCSIFGEFVKLCKSDRFLAKNCSFSQVFSIFFLIVENYKLLQLFFLKIRCFYNILHLILYFTVMYKISCESSEEIFFSLSYLHSECFFSRKQEAILARFQKKIIQKLFQFNFQSFCSAFCRINLFIKYRCFEIYVSIN